MLITNLTPTHSNRLIYPRCKMGYWDLWHHIEVTNNSTSAICQDLGCALLLTSTHLLPKFSPMHPYQFYVGVFLLPCTKNICMVGVVSRNHVLANSCCFFVRGLIIDTRAKGNKCSFLCIYPLNHPRCLLRVSFLPISYKITFLPCVNYTIVSMLAK